MILYLAKSGPHVRIFLQDHRDQVHRLQTERLLHSLQPHFWRRHVVLAPLNELVSLDVILALERLLPNQKDVDENS